MHLRGAPAQEPRRLEIRADGVARLLRRLAPGQLEQPGHGQIELGHRLGLAGQHLLEAAAQHVLRVAPRVALVLDEAVERFDWVLHAYVLMGNHVHLLLTPARADFPLVFFA